LRINTPFFMRAICASPIRFFVASVSGTCAEITSAFAITSSIVAVSTSEVDEAPTPGLSPLHQRALVVALARHVFAGEGRIAYGGDFRKAGFAKLLATAQRAHARSTQTAFPRIISYLTEALAPEERAHYVDAVRFVDVRFFDIERGADDSAAAKARSRAKSLRAMRGEIARDAAALVAVGGRTSGHTGWRPGIAEEIAAAVAADKPIYLVGGFGGAAGWYANAAFLGGEVPNAPAPLELGAETTGGLALPSVDKVVHALRRRLSRNGLTKLENAHLARTVDADEIVALVLSGLAKISK
jgi:hypothetical protein